MEFQKMTDFIPSITQTRQHQRLRAFFEIIYIHITFTCDGQPRNKDVI